MEATYPSENGRVAVSRALTSERDSMHRLGSNGIVDIESMPGDPELSKR